jgi:hypothetical protein
VGAAAALDEAVAEALGDALAVSPEDDAAAVLDFKGFGFAGSPEQPEPSRASTTREAARAENLADTVATPCVNELRESNRYCRTYRTPVPRNLAARHGRG